MMIHLRCLAFLALFISLISSTSAAFDINHKTNVAIYYGQGPNEYLLGLKEFCKNSHVDIIPLAFLDIYPAQGDGYPGTNFASSCDGTVYSAPGYDGTIDHSKDDLQAHCPTLVEGISYCQGLGKKILLSLGGAPGATRYQLTSNDDADYMAKFLWGAFGPLQHGKSWPRPFDDPSIGPQSVNGFDFDVEVIQPGEQQYYIRMIKKLKEKFPAGSDYIITGAPQCVVPDHNMGDIITAVAFDILFVQYYNTDLCSARNWITANPTYPKVPENPSGFSSSWIQLQTFLDGGASKNAKIYFGLPGAPAAASAGEYLDPTTEVAPFIEAYFCQPRFGGIMIWEGIYAYDNKVNGRNFQNSVKDILKTDSHNKSLKVCPTTTTTLNTATPTSSSTPCCTKTYTIVSGDTCNAIAAANGLTLAAFYALNPTLNDDTCRDLQIGQVVCVAGSPSPCGTGSSTGVSNTATASPTSTSTPCCTKKYTVVSGDTCNAIATANGLTLAAFYALNPGLNDNTCLDLQIGQVVCVAGSPSPCGTGSSTGVSNTATASPTSTSTPCCTKKYTVVSGDTCNAIATANGLTLAAFYALNPGLNDNTCLDLQIGQVVCVAGSPSPCGTGSSTKGSNMAMAPNTVTGSNTAAASPTPTAIPCCTKTHTVVSGDTCNAIATANGLTLAAFYALNPGLNDNTCLDIQIGQIFCVAGSPLPCGATSSMTTSTRAVSPTSTPCCTKKNIIMAGDTCDSIATANGLTLAAFYALNPGLNDDTCRYLQVGQIVCVAGSPLPCGATSSMTTSTRAVSPTSTPCCTKKNIIMAGDTCDSIATANGLTLAAFYALNPGLNDDTCRYLQVGQIVCVAGNTVGCTSTSSNLISAAALSFGMVPGTKATGAPSLSMTYSRTSSKIVLKTGVSSSSTISGSREPPDATRVPSTT